MSPTEEVPRLFLTKHCSLFKEISKFQSCHFWNVSTDPLETGRGFLEICGQHFRN